MKTYKFYFAMLVAILSLDVSIAQNYYKIINKSSSKALDVENGKFDNGTPIIQWEFKGGYNQIWEFRENGDYVQIINRATGKCIDVEGGNQDDGTRIIQWENNTGNNQLWEISQDEKGFYRIISKATGKALSISGPSNKQVIQVSVGNNSYQLWEITEVK